MDHSRINLLSTSLAPHELPSSPYFTPLSTLLQFNPFVVIISLDFSKAFDTVRHSMHHAAVQVGWTQSADACLQLAGVLFQRTLSLYRVQWRRSRIRSISASITWARALDQPPTPSVTAADLRPLNPDNILIKFADDTYLVMSGTRATEIDNIAAWAAYRITLNWTNLSPTPRKSSSATSSTRMRRRCYASTAAPRAV